MAKDKTETGFRILFDDASGVPFDMSGDLIIGSIQGGGKVLDQIDMQGLHHRKKHGNR